MSVDPNKIWALFMSDPVDFLIMAAAVIGGTFWFTWWLRGHISKERIAVLDERLKLAGERHTIVTQQLDVLKPEIDRINQQIRDLNITPPSPQLERTAGDAAKRFGLISYATAALGQTLTPSLGVDLAVTTPLWQEQTESNQSIYVRLFIGGWVLNFNPAIASPRARKKISFNQDGTVGDGKNKNEFTWKISNGLLEIYREDGTLQNKFKYDERTDKFICTNDPLAKGIKNQVIYRES